jgi:plastocyanin
MPEPEPEPTSIELDIAGFAFVAATVTVPKGTTVTWTNRDGARHTVTSETGVFDSGNLARNDSFSYSFTESGTFKYYCTIHPSMRGEIIVE